MKPPIMCAAQCEDRQGWKQINKKAFDANQQYHAACLDSEYTAGTRQDKEAETKALHARTTAVTPVQI
jgi:hypothetical protein